MPESDGQSQPIPISEYRIRRRVQFYETDAAGMVHFSCFNRYMEEAEHAMWRAAGMSIRERRESAVGWPRVAAAFEFHSPLRFEDEFEITIRITAIREKTISYACTLDRDGTRIATGSMTIVCVRKLTDGSIRSTPIPAEIASRFRVAAEVEATAS